VTRIAVVPGDGVGPEVTREAERVLNAVAALDAGVQISFSHFPWGSDFYRKTGQMLSDDALDVLRGFDAVLFGAVGDPAIPDHVTLRTMLLRIRFNFDLYVNLRPARLLRGVRSPLLGVTPADVDMLFVREGTEGEYAGAGGWLFPDSEREVALQTAVFSRRGIERVVRWAFELALRKGRSLTSVSKGNALEYSGVLWDRVFDEVAATYPQVQTSRLLVDAAAMFMVREPARFGVVVASNLFADILTDLSAGIMGGMGLAPSASIDPSGRFPAVFEPVHGSAPDIAGRGIANPAGAIWSASLLLDHVGHPDWGRRVVDAIESAIADDGVRTVDLGGTASTEDFGRAVVAALRR
jgi:tartrate dehydrogenase/decarboxylase/D-malate dehydrogenase